MKKQKKEINFLKKYFISAINVDKFSEILKLKGKGAGFVIALILLFSIITGIISSVIMKPKFIAEFKKIPNFKISEGKLEILDKDKKEEKYQKYEYYIISAFPNLTNKDVLKIKDGIRDEKYRQIEEGKSENESEFLKKEAKENNLEVKELKKNINQIVNTPVLVLKDSISINVNTKRYIPFSILTNNAELNKAEIIKLMDENLIKLLSPSFILANIIILTFLFILMKLAGSIYMSLNVIFANKFIYLIPEIRKKISNFSIAGPMTIFIILEMLIISEHIQGIDIFWISIIIYLIYIEIIARIILNDKKNINNLIKKYTYQTVIGKTPDDIMDKIEKREEEKRNELRDKENEDKSNKNEEKKEER